MKNLNQSSQPSMEFFSISELTASPTAARLGIDNTPPAWAVDNLRALVARVLDPARRLLHGPITVNSGYRCPRLNAAVGGADRSYHKKGRAADLTTGSADGNSCLMAILQGLPHTELIWERGGRWIHVAL